MTGPEALHAQITSGNPGTLRTLESDLRDAVTDLAWCVDHIVQATDVPVWQGVGAEGFARRTWATEAMAQVAQVRCDRAKLAVERMVAEQEDAHDRSQAVIDYWRQMKPVFQPVPIFFLLLRSQVVEDLTTVRDDYEAGLREALAIADSDELAEYQEAWFGLGLLRLMELDLANPTNTGPPIPDSLLGGDDENQAAAQGLGVDPGTGNLLQTSYNDDGEAVLSVIDPDTGEVLDTVMLGAGGSSDEPPDHAGGVMVDGNTVYVMSSSKPPSMYEYPLDQITDTAPGREVPVSQVNEDMAAGAYSTIADGVMYVGTHNEHGEGFVQPYEKVDGEWVPSGETFPAPQYAQGIAVHQGTVFFTSSLGRTNDPGVSTLHSYDLATGEEHTTVALPHMAEGLVTTPDGVVVTYESGSSKYDPEQGQDLDGFFPSPSMTVTPYSELGVVGPFAVESYTLQQSSQRFAEAESKLGTIEGRIRSLTLPASALGQVGAAAEVSTGIDDHLDQTARWLRNGHLSANLTVEGLLAAAGTYEEGDQQTAADFAELLGLT